ncbi:hypothetical protein V1512DRAFT_258707 [Lipomyces arxii]|uniref:uncharacterized protein n=1 Tax=Lipomyces arxii TaxID=56418 RepID=UPI0034CD4749
MPSKNSINKPKLAVRQARKSVQGQQRRIRRVFATTTKVTGIYKPDSVIRGRVLSKKQARKNYRNLRYFAQKGLIELATDEDAMTDSVSRTQTKKEERARLFAIKDEIRAQKLDADMEISSTGKGTTLGGPPQLSR